MLPPENRPLSTSQEQIKATPSNFVTVLAWVFIALTGFCTLISLLQNIMIQSMLTTPEMHSVLTASSQDKNMPFFAQFMFNSIRWLFAAFFVLSACALVSSVGLLKRKNWARIFFIAFMAFGIVWNIAGCALQLTMFSSIPKFPSGAPDGFESQFNTLFTVIAVFSAIMAIGFSVLFGWIIKRLTSLQIRLEFGAGP